MATPPKSAAPSASADPMLPAQLAKAALRRLVMDKLEPTPENYERAYQQEMGVAPSPRAAPEGGGEQLAELIDRIVRGVEQRSRQWTTARKKDSLQRVLSGSRGDAARLQQRLRQLVASWESEAPEEGGVETVPVPLDEAPETASARVPAGADASAAVPDWNRIVAIFDATVQHALPGSEADSRVLAAAIADASRRIQDQGATPLLADELKLLCQRAERVLQHRHHLLDQLGDLCRELTASLSDLAEDDSWAQGQCEAMRLKIDEGLTARGVKSVSDLLHTTRERQGQLRIERQRARDALKTLIGRMLSELDELGSQTGRFHQSVGRYADVIEKADTLESLTGVVREMVEESRTVQALVAQTQQRLHDEHTRASGLTQRVSELEGELRRLSEEVSTDQLTQIANRRGLMQGFEAERSRMERTGSRLCVGLLDIDNFKRLNDELGHGVGDEALKSLAAVVSRTLRPTDLTARYGGEEFVVLLPDTPVEEGQLILTRLQRSLSGGLFMHENKQIFVTFSAGVTAYRPGERIEEALERADQALYEAKRTGKNRTCIN
ncbi:GGDEF domain-containing protein [Piscinibacter sp. XHJ-5]|uniref:sensor domain-containing diguanylate cyclase n=1 Tax=Piscinibacter sp. XHJ-5 TaxID=3037797 RepID=UPI00245289E3|nr:GGDEF domain-containing protein [Piscinibacter sp. XHJ-5]